MIPARRMEELKAWDTRMSTDPDVDIYALGLCAASVCSRLGPAETVQRVNDLMEGVTTWSLSREATFANGEPQPRPCERGGGRTHYLLE